MLVKQIYTNCLAQASYYVESEGEAAIIDPIRDIDEYLALANESKAKIKYVLLTHFHADFVSGHLELAKKTGAKIVLGPLATPEYEALIASDHQMLPLGKCSIEVLHTPGHTIESACFLMYGENHKRHAVFTGDTLFVGDAGRPDLLSGNLDATTLAGQLFDSLEAKIKSLPDEVIVYPGHGAGSPCGKNLSKETWSTIGDQKAMNYALKMDKASFIAAVTTNQPAAPAYFFKDAVINKTDHESLEEVLKRGLKPLSPQEFNHRKEVGALVLDTRAGEDFQQGFINGAINVGLEGQYAIWVGTLVDFNHPLLLVTNPGLEKESITRLARIGYDNIVGYLNNGMPAWVDDHRPTETIQSISISQLLSHEMPPYTLLDVRTAAEVQKERIPGAVNIPLQALNQRLGELPKTLNYAIYCAGGYRSMVAASILKRKGFNHILNLDGGITKIKTTSPQLVSSL